MADIPLNTYIEWTEEDRERGKCPVPAGSDVTVWFEDGSVDKDTLPEGWEWDWGLCYTNITAYMVHSLPQQPREWWAFIDPLDGCFMFETHKEALQHVRKSFEPWAHPSRLKEIVHVREVLE